MLVTRNKMIAVIGVAGLAIPFGVMAASTNIDATANFQGAITLSATADMEFGDIVFSAAPGAGDTVTMATNGTLTDAGNFTSSGSGTAGLVTVTAGTNTQVVEVECDATATLSNGSGSTINVTTITVKPEGGADAACAGIGTAAATMTLNVDGSGGGSADTFAFGGVIDGATAAGFAAGAHSTASAGGNDIQVDVIYQ